MLSKKNKMDNISTFKKCKVRQKAKEQNAVLKKVEGYKKNIKNAGHMSGVFLLCNIIN